MWNGILARKRTKMRKKKLKKIVKKLIARVSKVINEKCMRVLSIYFVARQRLYKSNDFIAYYLGDLDECDEWCNIKKYSFTL